MKFISPNQIGMMIQSDELIFFKEVELNHQLDYVIIQIDGYRW